MVKKLESEWIYQQHAAIVREIFPAEGRLEVGVRLQRRGEKGCGIRKRP